MIKIINGNIFDSECQILVNPINCVGVMGAGLALQFKNKYPEMFLKYKQLCQNQKIQIGMLWIWKNKILNFPTKNHYSEKSKTEYLEMGFEKFIKTYREKNINSIAFPMLGAGLGGLDENVVLNLMFKYLENLNIYVEIYKNQNK